MVAQQHYVKIAEFGIAKWRENPEKNTSRIIDTFKKAATIAADNGERLAAEGLEPLGNTPEEFAALIKREMQKWSRVARDAGIKAE